MITNLPEYVCHKRVRACKLGGLEWCGGVPHLIPLDPSISPIPVTAEWIAKKWDPKPSEDGVDPGYYVQYQDGFESWSPSDAFEQGYKLSSEAV